MSPTPPGDPPAYVLVHGGRHGGWSWKRVAPALRQLGHEVWTPTLTGLGERAHLLHPDIGLDTHIRDLVALFEYEDITDAVLVAHSYAGMVVSAAMEEIADRVRCVVFVDAHMPREGESMLDLVAENDAQRLLDRVAADGDGWFMPLSDASYWGITDPDDVAWVNSRTTVHPIKTYTDRIGPTDRVWSHAGMFIECLTPLTAAPIPTRRPRERAAADPRFVYRVIDASHDAMVVAPEALTALLLEARTLS